MTTNDRRHCSIVESGTIARWWRTLVAAVICTMSVVGVASAADLRVMKTGLGEGTISASGISCGTGGSDCNEAGLSGSLTLTVSVPVGSRFTAWGGDCASVVVTPPATPPCVVDMSAMRSVRADFEPVAPIPTITDFSPAGLEAYLNANPSVDTPAELVAALPQEFRENWILMPRSESLQTGTARTPRILLASADATRVFTIGLETHPSYPGSHPSAIEYMQWDASTANFRFHEIVLATIPAMGDVIEEGPPPVLRFPERTHGPFDDDPVKEDDPKCFSCHSTRNVKHDGGSTPGTTGDPPGTVAFKARPNWDTYDSWGGMLAFNRDRIYQGSVEAAAFRQIFNLWTWQGDDAVRAVIEQLELQPAGVPDGVSAGEPDHRIIRWDMPPLAGGENDGHIQLGFDPAPPAVVTVEPQPAGTGPAVSYGFDRREGEEASLVRRQDVFVTLHHSCQPSSDEGRGVELFDRLTGGRPFTDPITDELGPSCPPRPAVTPRPNPLRIADELITHRYATGSVPIDVRPIALAIARGCIAVAGGTDIGATQTVTGVSATTLDFFDARNGLTFDGVYDDTRRRAQSLTRRKADIERTTLDRDADIYVYDPEPLDMIPIGMTSDRVDGLIRTYGASTLGIPGGTGGEDWTVERLRQEVFRRALFPGHKDETVMGGVYADREDDSTDSPPPPSPPRPDNTAPVALYRYFLEPLGVSVDEWSMSVRGRSRTYTFADVFFEYTTTFQAELPASLGLPEDASCTSIMALANAEFEPTRLPAADAVPTYTDIQRIFNKGCIECHGGLGYPPYQTYAYDPELDLSENASPPAGERRLWRSLDAVRSRTAAPACPPSTPVCPVGAGTDPSNSYLYQRITDNGNLRHPYTPDEPYDVLDPDDSMDPDVADERCPSGLMPCEGPPLSKVDIETYRRWIIGGRPNTEGDPHIETVDGVHYDFQSAGEFILLRGEGLELQARQTAVTTATPVGPDPHTGLTSCVSVNTAVAMRVGLDRVTYQPEIIDSSSGGELEGMASPEDGERRRLRLRIDGEDVELGPDGIALSSGGRITRTPVPDGIEIDLPGGEAVVVTPAWWDYYKIWTMNIEVRHARSTEGVMGAIAPGNWLPALSNGELLGARPSDPSQRHRDLYEIFSKSWRVDAKSSLFDYERGLSPEAFVVEDWPALGAQSCVAPPQPGGPVARPAPAAIMRADAEALCRAIVDPRRREHCIQDVMATGEPGFASTYEATEALERRLMPAPPVLVSPADHARVPAQHVEFEWAPQAGTEAIEVSYRHCIWSADELFDFNRCIELPVVGVSWLESLARRAKGHLSLLAWIALLVVVVIAVPLVVRYRERGVIVVLILAALVAALLLALARLRVEPPRRTSVADLVPGKVYFWKVVAETTEGVTVESQTRRLEVRE